MNPFLHSSLSAVLFAGATCTAAQTPAVSPAIKLAPFIVTTAAADETPLKITIATKAATQPIPAQDGADLLKTVPGFSVGRKGGVDGEPVLRGQAGSRLDLLLDGESALGGCPLRMDPPTAYIFPAAFDQVTVLKGPQTVLYGPGNSAGVVLFERHRPRLAQPGAMLDGSFTRASFSRSDAVASVRAGVPDFYVQAAASRSDSGDYHDGDGRNVHSRYERSSTQASAGWTPDANTLLELSGTISEGEAAYGYSMMDAIKLDRKNAGLRFKKDAISPLVAKVEAQVYYNYIDHLMDNYSLRAFTPTMMRNAPAASNPDYRLVGGRGLAELAFTDATAVTLGVDFQEGRHRSRSTNNQPVTPYESLRRAVDATIAEHGIFGELARTLAIGRQLIAGLRLDRWRAKDHRAMIAGTTSSSPNPTAQARRRSTRGGGFVRYEHDLESVPATSYVGLGYTERAPDYWELIAYESLTSKSAFPTRSEKTTQLDSGMHWRRGPLTASVSAFVNVARDYILVQTNVPKPGGMSGTGMTPALATVSRNVDASAWGGEAVLRYALNQNWKIDGSLASVRGRNKTDGLPLAQQPPLEGRFGFAYATERWSVGGLTRLVAEQNRFALDQGTIIGRDLGRTSGFAVFSLNAGWRVNAHALLTTGVDNVLDKTYAEHLSRNGGGVAGYPITTRVNEPGRTLWLRLAVNF